jgi:hypothetical protein
MLHGVTPEVIAGRLRQIVPPEQELTLEQPTTIVINARTTLGAVERLAESDRGRELVFGVPLQVHLMLGVDLMLTREHYEASAATDLHLAARAYTPLTIRVECGPILPDQITVTSAGLDNWLDLVKRFGVLDDAIKQQVAAMINRQVEASRAQRTIDVRTLIRTAMEVTGMVEAPKRRPKKGKGRGQAVSPGPSEPAPTD